MTQGEQITPRELSERDLLIGLVSDLRSFKEYTAKRFEDLERKMTGFTDFRDRLVALEVKVSENTKLRNWIYGAIITGLISIILSAIVIAGG